MVTTFLIVLAAIVGAIITYAFVRSTSRLRALEAAVRATQPCHDIPAVVDDREKITRPDRRRPAPASPYKTTLHGVPPVGFLQ